MDFIDFMLLVMSNNENKDDEGNTDLDLLLSNIEEENENNY